jgi:hypothetical protein
MLPLINNVSIIKENSLEKEVEVKSMPFIKQKGRAPSLSR